jgi:hypothetical protein
MQFIQLVEFYSQSPVNELRDSMDAWLGASHGKRALQMTVLAAERDQPNHYWELLEYPSEAEANSSAELPETQAAYNRWAGLLEGEPVFHNLDVMEQYGGPSTAPVEAVSGATAGAATPGAG